MRNQMIEVTTVDGVAEAYVTSPGDGRYPPVLFYIDAIGLRPRTKEMADRIAGWGYTALVPNVFYRDGTAAELAPTEDLRVPENRERFFVGAMQRVRAHTSDQSAADLEAYVGALQDLPTSRAGDIGVTGYCMGGRLAFLAACRRPDLVAATGVFHAGGLATDAPDSPHHSVPNARAELFFGHADQDRSNPAEAIANLEAALDEAGVTYTSEVFEGASHGYTMADGGAYDEAGTERHFRELEALFARSLG
ncbi:MAG: carboxymethylenebutenolidase [Nocardioidaceae bacterium]|jgi:carboxymethylenebutenolidase|nr:carboxymethylenebutenolidase [Nocardioidaceae bacterium]